MAAFSLRLLEHVLLSAARLPGATFSAPQLTAAAWMLVCTPVLHVVLPPGWPGRSVAFVAIGALVLYTPPRPPPGCVDVDVLDVGQGLAVVVTTHGRTLVYDTGPAYRGGGSAAAAVLLPFLRYRGVDRLDALVVSHADLDHAGGVDRLLAEVETGQVWTGEALPHPGVPMQRCAAGEAWDYDAVRFEFVYPLPGAVLDGNDASCVLLISAGEHRVLLPGDIERPAERELVQSGRVPPVAVVVVPHHGSQTSSSLPFVAALRPTLAIVSARYGNHWRLPGQDVVARWQRAGAEVLTTAADGAVGMRLCAGEGLRSLRRERSVRRRIWHE